MSFVNQKKSEMWFKFSCGMCLSNQRQSECCPQPRTKWLLETQYMGALSCQWLTHSYSFCLFPAPNLKNETIGAFLSAFINKTTGPQCNCWKLTIGLELRIHENKEAGSAWWRGDTSWLAGLRRTATQRYVVGPQYCPHLAECELVRGEKTGCSQKVFK